VALCFADALKETFGQLGFDVIVKNNLKNTEIVHLMWEMATKDHTDYDCFIAFFLSHGCYGKVSTQAANMRLILSQFRWVARVTTSI
jgi:hypothetical protein